jgi:RHS repeat-associated protein
MSVTTEGNKIFQIAYGHHRERISQQYSDGQNTTEKAWAGSCEFVNEDGKQKTLTYLSVPVGVFALHVIHPDASESIHYVHKDHLGSWHTITDEDGNLLQELSFDAWGTRRNPQTWDAFTGPPPAPLYDRGFTGHEYLYAFGLINMNGRMYDPLVSRMLSPDNFIQSPDFSQSFNRYSYAWNNPLVYTDPDGEIIIFIGIMAGLYQGAMIASNSGMSFGGALATIVAGGMIGGFSGYIGGTIANGSGIMSNTTGIMVSSYTNSTRMSALSGGEIDPSISFGFGSYNFRTGEFRSIFNWNDLSNGEKIGYSFGASANLRDVNEVINSTQTKLYTDNSNFISHTAIADKNTGKPLMSFGPADTKVPSSKLGYATYFRKSTSDYIVYKTLPVDITLNKYIIDAVRVLGKILPFQGITTNCVNMASLSLWLNGIPNIGLSPWVLYGTVSAYNAGVRPDLFSYYFTQYGR